jgi:glycosyltransferase involved in cell wall biosynthesis
VRILVNALSLGWLSGKHVLFGHLRQLAQHSPAEHEFVLLHRADTSLQELSDLTNVSGLLAPRAASHWTTRLAWEAFSLPRILREKSIDLYFSPTGTILPRSPVPQVTLAQNPWCMVPGLQRGWTEKAKAAIQRQAYRKAFREADLMVYNSQHMRDLYQRNAPGSTERRSVIVYQGIDESTFTAARSVTATRVPLTVLAVSVMAHWKGAEIVVAAIDQLRQQGIPAQLHLVGPWADPGYRRFVENEIARRDLTSAVTIVGEVSRAELNRHYATASVFCLMSSCESFGIPAIEAQAFGTPVVGSSTCAMAEVGAAGGEYFPPTDLSSIVASLSRLLTDKSHWEQLSVAARQNAERFHWAECSVPLRQIFTIR